jgi:phosphoribosylanthranilate isomerase
VYLRQIRMAVRIKICGITNPRDAESAASLGADMIGVNFYSESPRFVNEAVARNVVDAIPSNVEAVGVFVNEPWSHAQRIAARYNIRVVQMHGDLSDDLPPRLNAIPAFALRDAASLQHITSCLERLMALGARPQAILVDAHVVGQFGGTGQTAPWHLLADFAPSVPLILAGGLTPGNVADAIRIVKPYAVDVASGVESSPGKKDADKMRRFIDAVRSAI